MAERFILNETSYFGRGCRSELAQELKARGYKKVLFVTDPSLIKCGVAGKVSKVLESYGLELTVRAESITLQCFVDMANELSK